MADSNPTKVVTDTVRLSYANLIEPRSSFEGQPPKFSTALLISKDDEKTLSALRRAQKAALENGKSSTFKGSIPKNWSNTLRDGDEEMDTEESPEYAGHYFLNVSAQEARPPVLVNRRREKVTGTEAAELFYSGAYVRASLNAFPFNVSGNKGVSFGINAVQFVRDGEALGGGKVNVESEFDDLGDFDEDDDDDLI